MGVHNLDGRLDIATGHFGALQYPFLNQMVWALRRETDTLAAAAPPVGDEPTTGTVFCYLGGGVLPSEVLAPIGLKSDTRTQTQTQNKTRNRSQIRSAPFCYKNVFCLRAGCAIYTGA